MRARIWVDATRAALEPLARHAIDLNLLVSRPIPSRPFSYRFDAVLSGHPLDPELSATLKEMRELTAELRSELAERRRTEEELLERFRAIDPLNAGDALAVLSNQVLRRHANRMDPDLAEGVLSEFDAMALRTA